MLPPPSPIPEYSQWCLSKQDRLSLLLPYLRAMHHTQAQHLPCDALITQSSINPNGAM